jgi:hypothetical protein
MESVTGFENSPISPNHAGKFFMNTDLVGFGRRTGFAAKSQDFSPHKMFMNTNSGCSLNYNNTFNCSCGIIALDVFFR